MTTTPSSISYTLFGLTNPFLPPSWTTTDDRVRGGSSTSHLTALPHNSALFSGHLDTSTLGGAGFASQFSPIDAANSDSQTQEKNESWDLSAYSGIELEIGKVDEKMYTFILKDEEQAEKREDGREKSGVSWEVEFRAGDSAKEAGNEETTKIWIPWSDFKATYRGKEKKDAGSLRTGQIRRVGLMMRRFVTLSPFLPLLTIQKTTIYITQNLTLPSPQLLRQTMRRFQSRNQSHNSTETNFSSSTIHPPSTLFQ